MTIGATILSCIIVVLVYLLGVYKGRSASLDEFLENVNAGLTDMIIKVYSDRSNQLQVEMMEHGCPDCIEAMKDLFECDRVELAKMEFRIRGDWQDAANKNSAS